MSKNSNNTTYHTTTKPPINEWKTLYGTELDYLSERATSNGLLRLLGGVCLVLSMLAIGILADHFFM